MRLVTYSQGPAGAARVGVRVGHRVLDIESASRVDGEPLPNTLKTLLREGRGALSRAQALAKAAQSSAGRYAGAMLEERAIRFLPPVPDADRFLCAGRPESPEETADFAKRLVGHNAKVAIPAGRFVFEPQLVFVIGRRVLGFTAESEVMDYVVGATVLIAFADKDQRDREVASAALGPELVTLDEVGDLHDVWMTCAVNGEECMRVNLGEHIGRMADIVQQFSRTVAAEPGDMFSTGALGGTSAVLKAGDVVECSIEGVTTLRTTLVED